MRGGAGDVLDHGVEAGEFCRFKCGGPAALDHDHERETGLLGSLLKTNVLRDAIVGDNELASLQSVDKVAMQRRDLRGHGYQIGLRREAVGILLLRPESGSVEGERGKNQRTEGAASHDAGQYSCAAKELFP